jgi:hypothetical protein
LQGAKYDASAFSAQAAAEEMTKEESIPERGGSISRDLCRESSLRKVRDADNYPINSLGRRKRGKDPNTYIYK